MSAYDPSAGQFEQLAMPLFDALYNLAHWLTQNREEAEDLGNLRKSAEGLCIVPARDEFPRMGTVMSRLYRARKALRAALEWKNREAKHA